jgi:Reverse transcriptase (RNA-dependent DNA polymerase)
MVFFDLDADQLDAVTAFRNSKLDETIYCATPERFGEPGKCWLLQRALYGLRRAPRLWQQNFRAALIEMGMQPVSEDQCLYTSEHLMIFYFVDDLVILCCPEDNEIKEQFKKDLTKRFEKRFGKAQLVSWYTNCVRPTSKEDLAMPRFLRG